MNKLTIDCGPISYNDRSKLCHALIAEGYTFKENNEQNSITVQGGSSRPAMSRAANTVAPTTFTAAPPTAPMYSMIERTFLPLRTEICR